MEKIASFTVDHTTLKEGMYLSRQDGDIVTYDLRFCRPNSGRLLSNASIHTIEHLFATYVRNSKHSAHVIYFGPMGCRTGFYFIVRDMPKEDAISLTKETLRFIAEYEGEVPGCSAKECGNYLEHDLPEAKADCARMAEAMKQWRPERLSYGGEE